MRAEVLPQGQTHSAVLTPNQGSLPLTYTPRVNLVRMERFRRKENRGRVVATGAPDGDPRDLTTVHVWPCRPALASPPRCDIEERRTLPALKRRPEIELACACSCCACGVNRTV